MRRPGHALGRLGLMAVLGVVLAGLPAGPLPPTALAQDEPYVMTTAATYAVDPNEREIRVSVEVEFTNTTPNPPGQFSVFEVIDLAIHSGATDVTARDGSGALTVSAAENDAGVNVASVRPRSPVRFEQEVAFTLSYVIPDGAAEDVRIRPSIVIFPAWSFGTGGTVTVTLPVIYDVLVDGDELEAQRDGDSWRLESGEIADPTRWLSLVTASRPDAYATLERSVALDSGEVALQVRHWTDDQAWGEQTADLLAAALPALEELLGVGYGRSGPLVVVESLPVADGGFAEPPGGDAVEVSVAYSAEPFAVLHQAAHAFISERLATERWVREGFASWAAASLPEELGAEPPFDPEARTEELAEDAFPLVSWGAGESTPEQDAYAHAAAWNVAAQLAEALGPDGVRMTWARVAAGVNPYEPVGEELPEPGGRDPVAVDSRRLLDHVEAVSGQDLSGPFRTLVFDSASAAALDARAVAREAYASLLEQAGDWGGPEPVQAALAGWRFDEAQERMAEAGAWLEDRDRLLAEAEAAGLAVPARLRDQWRTAGGGPGARAELDAELAVIEAYATAAERAARERSLFERIGLLGAPDPDAQLAEARGLFAEGELRGALETAQEVATRLEHASTDGLLRIASFAIVLFVIGVGIGLLIRRRGEDDATDYTAAP
ncbi:MAG TPA: hypothetical protein VFH63_07220 [candidate division Zixibacteria bacterium]|nr:hypothetical protein [candidate division Zixibacteria bacterium]